MQLTEAVGQLADWNAVKRHHLARQPGSTGLVQQPLLRHDPVLDFNNDTTDVSRPRKRWVRRFFPVIPAPNRQPCVRVSCLGLVACFTKGLRGVLVTVGR